MILFALQELGFGAGRNVQYEKTRSVPALKLPILFHLQLSKFGYNMSCAIVEVGSQDFSKKIVLKM